MGEVDGLEGGGDGAAWRCGAGGRACAARGPSTRRRRGGGRSVPRRRGRRPRRSGKSMATVVTGRQHRRREDRRRALRDAVLRPRTAAAGFTGRTWLTMSQSPRHADRGQVLLHRRDRSRVRPDVGGHVERRDVAQPEPSRLAPPPASSRSRSFRRRTPGTRRRPASTITCGRTNSAPSERSPARRRRTSRRRRRTRGELDGPDARGAARVARGSWRTRRLSPGRGRPHRRASTLRSRCARFRRPSQYPPSGRRASSSSETRGPRSAARARAFPRSTGTP